MGKTGFRTGPGDVRRLVLLLCSIRLMLPNSLLASESNVGKHEDATNSCTCCAEISGFSTFVWQPGGNSRRLRQCKAAFAWQYQGLTLERVRICQECRQRSQLTKGLGSALFPLPLRAFHSWRSCSARRETRSMSSLDGGDDAGASK